MRAAQMARRMAPPAGPLAGDSTLDRLSRAINDMAADRPSATRKIGLASVAFWKSLWGNKIPDPSEPHPATILFTDLVEFSRWALRAGDDSVLELIDQVNRTCRDVITAHGGHVVKTLGDGTMAVFADPAEGIEAAFEATSAVRAIQVDAYRPALRAGLHTGAPRAVGDDFLGVDVNIAARVCDAAGAGEVLISQTTLDLVGEDGYVVKRRRFRAKGVPRELKAYRVVPRYGQEAPLVR